MSDWDTELEQLGPWYHTIELEDGLSTPGKGQPARKFETLQPYLPKHLEGLDVLDLGCNAGGVSVEFARRGARVVGVEASAHYHRQAVWVRDRLGLTNFEPVHMPVYDIGTLSRTFDIVLFLGLVYHLRYPQLALDTIAAKSRGHLFLSTPAVFLDAPVMENRLPAEITQARGPAIPPAAEGKYNWWFPSEAALRAMLRASGFGDIEIIRTEASGFRSSSGEVDNRSAFDTGNLWLKAERFVADQHGEIDSPVEVAVTIPDVNENVVVASPRFSEIDLVLHYLREPIDSSIMVDVGAHIGQVSEAFAARGWRCVAFEPDPENFAELEKRLAAFAGSIPVRKAVADKTESDVKFFRSTEFWGIHSLFPYHPTHEDEITVETVRLDDALDEAGVDSVDMLKIDAEGADFIALQSIDLQRFRPRVVMVEFAGERTRPLGHDHHDIVRYMAGLGYAAWVSEWAPIVAHSRRGGDGGPFDFLRCSPYPVVHEPAWGNLLFVPQENAVQFDHALAEYLYAVSVAQRGELSRMKAAVASSVERADQMQIALHESETARKTLRRRLKRRKAQLSKLKQGGAPQRSAMRRFLSEAKKLTARG